MNMEKPLFLAKQHDQGRDATRRGDGRLAFVVLGNVPQRLGRVLVGGLGAVRIALIRPEGRLLGCSRVLGARGG